MRAELLGRAAVVLDDGRVVELRPTMRDQALAHLAVTGDAVRRERLGFLFWPDVPDTVARHNVRQLLKRIRRLPWLAGFEAVGELVSWHVEADVRELLGERSTFPAGGTSSGELLPGFERSATVEYEDWLLRARRQVGSARRAAGVAAAEAALANGLPERAMDALRPLLATDDDGSLLAQYLELALAGGHRDEALATFEEVAARLRDEVGVRPPQRALDLARAARDRRPTAGATPRIVGRAAEIATIAATLQQPECRLLTLVGPGGIGKSALAGAVADRIAVHATVVPLASLVEPELVPLRIAAACGVTLDGRLDAFDQLSVALHDRRLVLVLDNAEHLPAAWPALPELLRRCPQLTIVVTSRIRLRLGDEWLHEVGGLSDRDAVELLADRARRLAPGVRIATDEALELGRAVGGSPLGIELAAPWLRVMSVSDVLRAVGEDASMLTGARADAPGRHHSVEAAMAHSWSLATPDERAAAAALSVFADPYTLDLACEVADVDAVVVRDLVDQSLVGRRADGRLASHPLVRQYARARLAADDARLQQVRQRHACAVLMALADGRLHRVGGLVPVDDTVAAWAWCVDRVDVDLLDRSTDAVVDLLDRSGRHEQGLRLLASASASLEATARVGPATLAAVHRGRMRLAQRLGRHEDAAAAGREAVERATAAASPRQLVLALVGLGWARKWLEGDEAQHATTQEALDVAVQLDDDGLLVEVLNGLGCSATSLERCRRHLSRGLDVARRSSLRDWTVVLLNNLGTVSWALGESAVAHEHLLEALEGARAADGTGWLVVSLHNLAFVQAQDGDLSAARRSCDDAEELGTDDGPLDNVLVGHLVQGEVRRRTGDVEGAERRAARALRLARAVGNEALVLRALRLHGLLLLDAGATQVGLRVLAAVLPRTARRGDFTSEIVNPATWAEVTATADRHEVASARGWATGRTIEDVVQLVGVGAEAPAT